MMNHSIQRKKRLKLGVTLVVFAVIGLVGFWNQPVIKQYRIETDKLSMGTSIRILQISDLHSSIYGEHQEKLLKLIKKQNPDIIVLTGDIVDDISPEIGAYELIEGLVEHFPMYYVTGNHEMWHSHPSSIIDEIEKRGVILLEDRYETIRIGENEIVLAGIFDPHRNRREKEASVVLNSMKALDLKSMDEKQKELYTVLLAHRPEHIDTYLDFPIDLILSGHAHGGQVRIPFLINGLYSPNQGSFPKYAGGLYKFKKQALIVSRGLSYNPRLPRVFNPPEVVIIDIYGG